MELLAKVLFGVQLLAAAGNVDAVIPDPTCEYYPESAVYRSAANGLIIFAENEPIVVSAKQILPAREKYENRYRVCDGGLQPPVVYEPQGASPRPLPRLHF